MAKQISPFINMLRDAVGGAIAGLIAGLILGVAIKYITLIVLPSEFQGGPAIFAPFCGMGLGALVGAVLGGIVGLKRQ
ncbi:hypothetical protein EPN81_01430 [Patescibacteria group bacterium]|nr:MAG: hypothetical protein EPN81_01430 [Patescibacteria group bacterium]